MYKIIFEKYAKQHLIDILTFYTLQGGLFLAEKNKNKLSAQIDRLKTYPNIYPICEIEPRLQQMVVQKLPFKVYYWVNETEKTVHIFAILHTSRNHNQLFEELELDNFFEA